MCSACTWWANDPLSPVTIGGGAVDGIANELKEFPDEAANAVMVVLRLPRSTRGIVVNFHWVLRWCYEGRGISGEGDVMATAD